MKRILTIALIAAFVLPAVAMAYTVTITQPNSSTVWDGTLNSADITWTLSPDTDEIDSFYVCWIENQYNPNPPYDFHDYEIEIGPNCWIDGDSRCCMWTVTSCITHYPFFPYYCAQVTIHAYLNGRSVACDTSDYFTIINIP